MNASVKFLPSTLKQTGTVGKILTWMQQHPNQCRKTSVAQLGRTFSMTGQVKTLAAQAQIQKMVNAGMLQKLGSKRRANFYINYFHPDMPGYILENAPAEEQERIEKTKTSLKENQYIDDDGCVVTPNASKTESNESEITITENEPIEEVNQAEEVKSSSDISEENTTNVPIKIVDTERGLNISITLNLNINK